MNFSQLKFFISLSHVTRLFLTIVLTDKYFASFKLKNICFYFKIFVTYSENEIELNLYKIFTYLLTY